MSDHTYSTEQAAKRIGVSRSTLLRWIREKKVVDVERRDRNGWRVFTEADIARLKESA